MTARDAPPTPMQILRSPGARQLVSFGTIGLASTIAYVALYAALRLATAAAVANGLALVVTAIGNTAANRRLTFNVRGAEGLARDHLAGLVALVLALAITTGSIAVLGAVAPRAGRAAELGVLVAANALATVLRFVVLRESIGSGRTMAVQSRNVGTRGEDLVDPDVTSRPARSKRPPRRAPGVVA